MTKVFVYAICKNESAFARRWYDSMSEADAVIVLDTGSTDGTPELLRELGATVYEETVTPWRFDTARNRALELVPEEADLCVCTDLDEVFRPGWREAAQAVWEQGAHQLAYPYIWSHTSDGGADRTFYLEKMHSRTGWTWVNPVHEVLQWQGPGVPQKRYAPQVLLEHFPDPAKSREQYLPLLELAVREDPENDRNMHYLGREYYFKGRWVDCIRTLERHLSLKSARWRPERCASMRYLAKAWRQLGSPTRCECWLLRAVAEAPELREPWIDLAEFYYERKDWQGVLFGTQHALAITERTASYITEGRAWGSAPYDLASLACYYTGRFSDALWLGEQALTLEPENERLKRNVQLMREKLAEQTN